MNQIKTISKTAFLLVNLLENWTTLEDFSKKTSSKFGISYKNESQKFRIYILHYIEWIFEIDF